MDGRPSAGSDIGAVAAVCAVDLGDCSILSLQYNRDAEPGSGCAPELVEFRIVARHHHWIARVRRQAIEDRLTRKLGKPLSSPLEFVTDVPEQTGAGQPWQELVKHLCEVSVTAPAVLAHPDVRAQYSRTLIELLLHCVPHNYSRSLQRAREGDPDN